ncbi:hypothetical protein EDD15DRAFT_2381292 [Pisolithus albus]|nr:hypothetical protein EDD15DRAFT_2381292 [Pisolithus albus]
MSPQAIDVSEPYLSCSCFPDDIEREIFFLAASPDTGNCGSALPTAYLCHYLLVAQRVHHWLEPVLYQVVDVHNQKVVKLFLSSLRPRPAFAKRAVKVLHLRPAVSPEQGAEILKLCQGLQELTLRTHHGGDANQLDVKNPLLEPLRTLQPMMLSIDLASAFYGPTIFLPDLPLLLRIERLHLANSWVARRGLRIGLQELCQLTHLSFHIRPPGQHTTHNEILCEILRRFPRLQVVVLWRMEYHDCEEILTDLERHNLVDHRVVVFNTAHFATHAGPGPKNSFWEVAEHVVKWREDNNKEPFDVPSDEPALDLLL